MTRQTTPSSVAIAATAEPSKGIGSVNQALTPLDGMTQQNAARVEESAAAESRRDQAGRLAVVIQAFRRSETAA